ncbi:MAG: TIGR02221 family CRISPR-associated protein, partial [Chloroflexota bacterium]|nr:TIGR02221 family CRISPR-associated protein [Chloroflexota bacterium]
FLGPTDYSPTTYTYGEREFRTRFFAASLPHFFPELEQILVFCTPIVQEHPNLAALQERLGDLLQMVPIPAGHSEAELWQTFDALTETIAEADTVIFDITNSFRSIPLLVFLAAAYLRAVRQVNVQGVIYGAFEARDRESNRTPVFDLTPFVGLLDWLTACTRFVEIGDGRPLAALLRERMPPGLTMRDDLYARAVGRDLRHAASAIENISLALSVTRPLETMEAAGQLDAALSQARDAVSARARPFALLADQVRDSYAPFSLAAPLDRANWPANLRLQLAMIRWYLDKERIVQAATLAREWLVSLVAYRVGAVSLVDFDGERFPIEGALNNESRRRAGKEVNRPSPRDADVAALPALNDLIAVWGKMTSLRNDIAHVGMNEQPQSASTLCRKMTAIYPELDDLAQILLRDSDQEET